MARRARVGVLTVDDHEVFRRAARGLIEATPGFETLGEAASGPEAVALAARLHPDLVLVDVRMDGMDGLETARRLRGAEPDAVVVLVSIGEFPEVPPGTGAAACVPKQELSVARLLELWDAHRPRRA
jgi:DNA-binding NarL/FixJ family response regulator